MFIVSHKGGHLFSRTYVSGIFFFTMVHVAFVLLMAIGTNLLCCVLLTSSISLYRFTKRNVNCFQFCIINVPGRLRGLGVAWWPLVPKFAGSNPAKSVGFLGRKNPLHTFLRRGSKAVGPMS